MISGVSSSSLDSSDCKQMGNAKSLQPNLRSRLILFIYGHVHRRSCILHCIALRKHFLIHGLLSLKTHTYNQLYYLKIDYLFHIYNSLLQ